jgi:hypothetical protein
MYTQDSSNILCKLGMCVIVANTMDSVLPLSAAPVGRRADGVDAMAFVWSFDDDDDDDDDEDSSKQ